MLPVADRPAVSRALAKNPEERFPTCVEFIQALRSELGQPNLVAGAGSMQPGLNGLQQSRREARQALAIQERLDISTTIACFSDLGVYRLLFAAEHLP